jgi:hypothetical protein
MMNLLREVGIPPVMLGAMRHSVRGITEEQVRQMCARVGVGMLAIYAGGNVRESLDPATLLDDEVLGAMVDAMRQREPAALMGQLAIEA